MDWSLHSWVVFVVSRDLYLWMRSTVCTAGALPGSAAVQPVWPVLVFLNLSSYTILAGFTCGLLCSSLVFLPRAISYCIKRSIHFGWTYDSKSSGSNLGTRSHNPFPLNWLNSDLNWITFTLSLFSTTLSLGLEMTWLDLLGECLSNKMISTWLFLC